MTDVSLQRLNMVESQVRPSDVTDRRIIRAFGAVAREAFVPAARKSLAYMDEAIAVTAGGPGQAGRQLLAPRLLAKLLQLAGLEAGATVLDVGCATGYSTAVIARIVRRVVALEADGALAAAATRTLADLGVANATVVAGDLAAGRPADGPYDCIVLNGAVPSVPAGLLDQLKDGGRLVAIVAAKGAAAGKAVVCTRAGKTYDQRDAFDAGAAPLPGFAVAPRFVL